MNDTQPSAQRGDNVCRPADWIDVVKFLGFNFALHAMTVVPLPGANFLESTVTSLFAILIPFSGVIRAMQVHHRLVFLWGGGELGKALSAGALCTLVPAGCALDPRGAVHRMSLIEALRSHVSRRLTGRQDAVELPPQDPVPAGIDATMLEQVSPLTTVVHGQYPENIRRLYTGLPGEDEQLTRAEKGAGGLVYTLVAVPPSFSAVPVLATHGKQASLLRMLWDKVRGRQGASGKPVAVPLRLSCNYSFLRTSAALIQILYGSYELYMVSGNQIRQYGYAAYQFTVIPYVIMSIVNLLAGLSAPSYPARYIVHYRGLEKPSKTKEPATSGDSAEHGKQAVSAISILAEGTRADMANGAAAMQEEAKMRAREIYPRNWWNKEERDAVERMVGGAVGYVYGDFTKMQRSMTMRSTPAGDRFKIPLAWFLHVTIILCHYATMAAPYVVLHLLTGFDKGESTALQRGFIMAWLVLGLYNMVIFLCVHHNDPFGPTIRLLLRNSPVVGAFAVAAMAAVALFPALAGFYTASTMILNDRICSRA